MKILLATDGSEYSEEAARFLKRFNFTSRDEINILHVISQVPYADDYYAQIKQAIRMVAPKILRASADILKHSKAKILTSEKDGYPDTTIIETAVNSDADMIVMGARGVKGIKLLVLGSSTRAVAINSPKPVLIVKMPLWNESEKMKVLFATDGSKAADAAGRFLTTMPFPDDTELTVIHVAWSAVSDIPERYTMEINERIKKETARIRTIEIAESEKIIEAACLYLEKKFKKIHNRTKIGDPFTEILQAEKILKPDVIAVGCKGLRGIKGMMGSVSRKILGYSKCSVLVGKTV